MTRVGIAARSVVIAMAFVEMAAPGQKVQAAPREGNHADDRQQNWGGELPKDVHKGRYVRELV
jgi:hypothetical protein